MKKGDSGLWPPESPQPNYEKRSGPLQTAHSVPLQVNTCSGGKLRNSRATQNLRILRNCRVLHLVSKVRAAMSSSRQLIKFHPILGGFHVLLRKLDLRPNQLPILFSLLR